MTRPDVPERAAATWRARRSASVPDESATSWASQALGRRAVLGTAAACLLADSRTAHASLARAVAYTRDMSPLSSPTVVMGGDSDTIATRIGPIFVQALQRGLERDTPLAVKRDVGRDGVTAANVFDTDMAADGQTAVLTPGAGIVAALVGDPRVHFDYSRWVPVALGRRPVVTLIRSTARQGFGARMAGLIHDRPLRLAVSQPTGVEIASLLGMTLLGLHPIPVPGIVSVTDGLDALQAGTVDAIQITSGTAGATPESYVGHLPSNVAPAFQINAPDAGIRSFEQTFLETRHSVPTGPLYAAWRAVADAAATGFLLALPMLSPPPCVALWRHAAAIAAADADVESARAPLDLTIFSGAQSAPLLADLTPDLTALLALRRWVATNTPRWRAGQETRPT